MDDDGIKSVQCFVVNVVDVHVYQLRRNKLNSKLLTLAKSTVIRLFENDLLKFC